MRVAGAVLCIVCGCYRCCKSLQRTAWTDCLGFWSWPKREKPHSNKKWSSYMTLIKGLVSSCVEPWSVSTVTRPSLFLAMQHRLKQNVQIDQNTKTRELESCRGIHQGSIWHIPAALSHWCVPWCRGCRSLNWLSKEMARGMRAFKSQVGSQRASSSFKWSLRLWKNTLWRGGSFHPESSASIQKSMEYSAFEQVAWWRVNRRVSALPEWSNTSWKLSSNSATTRGLLGIAVKPVWTREENHDTCPGCFRMAQRLGAG